MPWNVSILRFQRILILIICFDFRDGKRLSSGLVQVTKGAIACSWYVILDDLPVAILT